MLPTRDMCKNIVKNSEAFYVSETVVNGYQVEMYDYRLAAYKDFKDNNAFELRGLTFVYNDETMEWERNLLLNKFFNVNQVSADDLLEIVIDGELLKVDETHNFQVKNNLGAVICKFARDLTYEDDIIGWDEIKVQ